MRALEHRIFFLLAKLPAERNVVLQFQLAHERANLRLDFAAADDRELRIDLSRAQAVDQAHRVIDNLIFRREIPVMLGVFINPGRRPDQPEPTPRDWGDRTTNRPEEYNEPNDRFALDVLYNYQQDKPSGTSFKSLTYAPTDPTTGKIPPDLESQVRNVFSNVRRIIEAAGGTTDDILKLNVWMKDKSQRALVNEEWLKMFPDEHSRPARHSLLNPDLPGARHGRHSVFEIHRKSSFLRSKRATRPALPAGRRIWPIAALWGKQALSGLTTALNSRNAPN